MADSAASPLPRVADKAGADALVASVSEAMQALEALLAAESCAVGTGRLRQGLADPAQKSALAAAYVLRLEAVKANAVALARFAPGGLERLRAEHRRFTAAVERNQTVLGTARSVSETLIKSLADDLGRAAVPMTYGRPSVAPSPYGRGVRSGPLILSRNL
ncbi:hypothetical protein [Methylobacterium radiodurans]|uniref:FlgN family protein n=1 Tax=Methylobacterium radiodurans TaxID=2202828 RepID=A0A2U8VX07_9HYPH|nr:hypothetical protein [Methylobacterium radiodurans]AWN38327.1 hypothetical protein DK427_23405 [Methylobacterium radiodurans]